MPKHLAGQLVLTACCILVGSSCTSSQDELPAIHRDAAASDAGAPGDADAGSRPDSSLADAGSRPDSSLADAGSQAPDAGHLAWFTTCGQPICRPGDATDAGADACDAGQRQDASCSSAGAACDPGVGCGVKLLCTDSDPKLRGCPISRASFKLDIRYLNNSDVQRYHDQVVGLGLAHYTYRNDPSAQERLGFIIEDVEPIQFVDEARDRVDLYAYTSAVIAAVKVQEQRIEELEREVKALRRQAEKKRRRRAIELP